MNLHRYFGRLADTDQADPSSAGAIRMKRIAAAAFTPYHVVTSAPVVCLILGAAGGVNGGIGIAAAATVAMIGKKVLDNKIRSDADFKAEAGDNPVPAVEGASLGANWGPAAFAVGTSMGLLSSTPTVVMNMIVAGSLTTAALSIGGVAVASAMAGAGMLKDKIVDPFSEPDDPGKRDRPDLRM